MPAAAGGSVSGMVKPLAVSQNSLLKIEKCKLKIAN
jgi:hypothetical protein